MRSGTHALSLLANPLNAHVLDALADGPKSLFDVRRAAGSPPQTTMRGHLQMMSEAGIVERRRLNDFPGQVDLQLTPSGRHLLTVARALRHWLAMAPDGPIELGTPAAKSSIKALVDGWSTGIIRVLAARPMPLTELSKVITGVSYPSLERRLGAMRLAGQLERRPGQVRGTPYGASTWLRHAASPLTIASRWERRHLPEQTDPVKRIDVEAALLLAVPLAQLGEEESGTCRLAVQLAAGGSDLRIAGVVARVLNGKVVSCVARLAEQAEAWASGSTSAWFDAAVEGEVELLEVGGACDLAIGLIDGVRGAILDPPQPAETCI